MKNLNTQKIDSLTGLRFCAAYMVLLSHVFGKYFLGLINGGCVSVQLFFTLSGFVMYLNYIDKIEKRRIDFKTFFLLRVIRLYPVYLMAITGYLLFNFHFTHSYRLFSYYFANVFMIQSWVGDMAYAFSLIDAPSWSVSNEMFFYVVFFFVAYTLPVKKAFKVFIAYLIINIFIICYLETRPDLISFKWVWYINPLFRVCDFLVGYFVGYLFLRFQYARIFIWSRWHTLSGILALLILFGSQFILPMSVYWYSIFLTSLVSAYVILNLAFNKGVLSKILSTRLMVVLGDSSYTLYLIHYFFIFALLPIIFKNHIVLTCAMLFLPVITSVLIYKFFEIKIYHYFKNKLYNFRKPTSQAATEA